MARRRGSRVSVDMFPFLSVLCSVIGVLMLFMMIVISTRVIEAEEQLPAVTDEAAQQEEGIQDGIKSDDYKRLDQQIATTEALVRQRIKERDELRQKIRRLQDLVRTRRRQIAQAGDARLPGQALGAKKKVQPVQDPKYTVPGGLTPVFVEVSSEGYRLQPDDVLYSPVKKDGNRYTADAKLEKFVAQMTADRDKNYLILLIHPTGVTNYRNLREYLFRKQRETRKKINVGSEPFSSDWEFIRKKKP